MILQNFTGREPHPILPTLTEEEEGRLHALGKGDAVEEVYRVRRRTLEMVALDPLRFGYIPENWKKVDEQIEELRKEYPVGVIELVGLGGNRSGKTHGAARRVVNLMVNKPNARVWCLQSTQATSRADQQGLVFDHIPPEWRPSDTGKLRRGRTTKIVYSDSGGFTEDTFVLPNGSQCWFKFYGADVKSIEGAELDMCWCFIGGTKIATMSSEKNIEEINPGELVKTRDGFGKVVACASRTMPVGRVRFSNGKELVGTSEHLVATSHGWTRLSKLSKGDKVCAIDVSNGMERRGTHMESATISGVASENGSTFIGRFTSLSLEQFHEAVTFTTRTETSSTTTFGTLNASQDQITCDSIFGKEASFRNHGVPRDSLLFDASIVGLDYKEELHSLIEALPVVEAANLSGPTKSGKQNEFAQSVANDLSADEGDFAASVVSTWEDAGEAEVFNLQVAGLPEYFANGILTHNCDELIKPDWIEALRFRLVTRNGLLLLTFTPADGYSATVREYLDGARTLEEETAELLPPPDNVVPRVQRCTGERTYKARVVYFHTKDNPFGNYEAMKMELARSSRDRILTRAYGVATKAVNSQFLFKDNVHVMSLNKWMEIQKKYPNMTRYHLVDPCSGRPWFMGWFGCPYPKKYIMYREWPSTGHPAAYIEGIGDPGQWAVPGNAADGDRGPAQRPIHFGLSRYKTEILRVENGEDIFERWMDARYGNSAKTEEEGTTTLIEQMSDLEMEFIAMTSEKKILGTPDGSIDLINSALYYDPETPIGQYSSAPGMDRINEPEFMIVETCPNSIFAYQNWTGKDGQEGACKDPIDLGRGFFLSELGCVNSDSMRVRAKAWKR